MIKFLVNFQSFEISEEDINNFPIKEAYLNVLVRHFKEKTFGVECKDGGIVVSTEYSNFDKIVKIYKNPLMSFVDLLSVDWEQIERNMKSMRWFGEDLGKEQNERIIKAEPLLCDTNYNRFIEELQFYGIYSLFEKKKEIDIDSMIKKIYQKLLFRHFGDKKEVLSFIHSLRRINAYISGSFILETILDEEWENTDIDIYVNESILMNFCYTDMPYILEKGLEKKEKRIDLKELLSYSSDTKSEEDTFVNSFHSFPDLNLIGEKNLEKKLQKKLEKNLEKKLEKKLQKDKEEQLNNFAKNLVASFGKDYRLVKVPTRIELDDGYGICSHLTCVIKMQFRDKVNIDLVIVNCTVPYFIQHFDLKFNCVYFDTYTIHSFNWKSIISKKSINYYKYNRYCSSEIERYLSNIKRIIKYFSRGFIVTYKDKDAPDERYPNLLEMFDNPDALDQAR
jgi:hypothetical protein